MAKFKELSELSTDELSIKLRDLKQEGLNLRLQAATGQLENTARIKAVRREIAQVNTIFTSLRNKAAAK